MAVEPSISVCKEYDVANRTQRLQVDKNTIVQEPCNCAQVSGLNVIKCVVVQRYSCKASPQPSGSRGPTVAR